MERKYMRQEIIERLEKIEKLLNAQNITLLTFEDACK